MEVQLKIRLNVSCGWRSIPFSIIGHCRSDEVQFYRPADNAVLLLCIVFHNIISYISTVSIKSLLADHRIPTSILCYEPFMSASAMSSAHSSILCQSKSASEVYWVSGSRYWQVTFLRNTRSRTWETRGSIIEYRGPKPLQMDRSKSPQIHTTLDAAFVRLWGTKRSQNNHESPLSKHFLSPEPCVLSDPIFSTATISRQFYGEIYFTKSMADLSLCLM